MINVNFNLATSKDLFTLVVSSDTELTLESISSILNGVITKLGENNETDGRNTEIPITGAEGVGSSPEDIDNAAGS